jgi:predicted RNA-binding Zn ribbon-like protein
VAGNLALDFANTAEWHSGPAPTERLTSYAAAVGWAHEHGVLSEEQVSALLGKAASEPEGEAEALARVIDTREVIYRVLSAVAHHQAPTDEDLVVLAGLAQESAGHLMFVLLPEPVGQADPVAEASGSEAAVSLPRFGWVWSGLEQELTGFLLPVAHAATDLLTSGQLIQLRQCAGDPCGWLFLDFSKNGSRRWCDMADCGNRAKARRYRERKKGSAPGRAVPVAESAPMSASPSAEGAEES